MLCGFVIVPIYHFWKMNLVHIFNVIVILMMELDSRMGTAGGFLHHSKACQDLLDGFAGASADFVSCTLQNARPVNICCSCAEKYNRVLDEHSKITQVKSNTSCNEKLINQDRLEVIENSFTYIKDLWSKGQCKNCFENKTMLSNTTKEFIKLYSDTNNCTASQYNPDNNSYNPDVCHICSEIYYKMSKFYAKLKEATGNGNVCMDIVDSVNVTQHLWSNVLHCGETVMTVEIPLIAISTTFCIIPIFFYTCAWIFTKDRSSAVLNQNRISQRFRERWRSRTGSSISS